MICYRYTAQSGFPKNQKNDLSGCHREIGRCAIQSGSESRKAYDFNPSGIAPQRLFAVWDWLGGWETLTSPEALARSGNSGGLTIL